jgi:alkylation response protein AidB-like acyl-CoA dehydrogenase
VASLFFEDCRIAADHCLGKPGQGLKIGLTALDTGRIGVAALKDKGQPFSAQAAMAKLHCSTTARTVTNLAVQIHGGYGYSKEYDVERYFRDVKVTEIYEGTSEIQRMVIARDLLTRPV